MRSDCRFHLSLLAAMLVLSGGARARAETPAPDEPVEAPVPAAALADDAADEPVEAPVPFSLPPERIPELVADLDSASYEKRQEATRLLAYGGAAAVEPLAQVAREGSLEAAVRAVRILEMLYLGGNDDTFGASGEALESLALEGNTAVAGRARQVLQMHGDLRERRAIAAILRLGGVVKYADYDVFINAQHRTHRQVTVVHLGANWRGGDEGLKYVRRIEYLPQLYIEESRRQNRAPVSRPALEELLADMPQLEIQVRGSACLGVRSDPRLPHCLISGVDPGTAAAKAGLREYDIILSFGGEPTPSFTALVDLIKTKYDPGDDVEVEIQRGGQQMTLTVTLDEWKAEAR